MLGQLKARNQTEQQLNRLEANWRRTFSTPRQTWRVSLWVHLPSFSLTGLWFFSKCVGITRLLKSIEKQEFTKGYWGSITPPVTPLSGDNRTSRSHISKNTMGSFLALTSHARREHQLHYNDVIMCTIASQITSVTIVYSTGYSDADQRKHQSSASMAVVRGSHRDRWIPRTNGQWRGKCFHFMT